MNTRRPLSLEALETRDLPSTLAVVNGVLYDVALSYGRHNLTATPGPTPGTLTFTNDGQSLTVPSAAVTDAVFLAGPGSGSRVFQGVNGLAAQVTTEGDHAVIYDVAKGGQTVSAYGDYSTIQATAGQNTLGTAGYGALILGGTGDTDSANGDRSTIYNIVGGATLNVGSHSKDYVFANTASVVSGVLPTDTFARFFAPGRTPGVFALQYDPSFGGTVYATADQAGDTLRVFADHATLSSPLAGTLTVTYATSPRTVAAFGGAGTDSFAVYTDSNVAMYGQGGPNNVLYAAGGDVNILKTGATASTSIANGRLRNYATGANPGQSPDTIVQSAAVVNTVFSQAADTLVGFRPGTDTFVGPTAAPTGRILPFTGATWLVDYLMSLPA